MKTEKIYESSGHIKHFVAKVLSCTTSENGYFSAILDKTAFFPEGGGQLADTGTIGIEKVLDVQIKDGEIVHTVTGKLEKGRDYDCELDFEKRFSRMQHHSGEHIVSGIVHKLFGYDNTGFHMGHEDVTMDYNGVLSEADIRKIEIESNRAIYENVKIDAWYPTDKELKEMHYRSKLDLEDNIRIVKIGDFDLCACCAPHVSRTGEIGIIKLLDFAKNKGGTRIHMLCGEKALKDYDERYHMISDIAQSLSIKQNSLGEAIKRMESEAEERKNTIYFLRQQLIEYKMANLKQTNGNICIFDQELTNSDMRKMMNRGLELCNGICAVFSGNDNTGYTFVAGSKNILLKNIAKELSEKLSGKCGGTDEMLQGNARCKREEIEKYFSFNQG